MPIATNLDDLFGRYAGPIPLPYLRALAYHESGLNPRNVNPKSNATGLFQITAKALADYNKASGTAHRLAELVNPELATKVAVRHLAAILKLYSEVPSLRPDWASRRFIELLTFGWNSGHNGVARLAKALEAQGISGDRVNVDTIGQLAAKTAVPYLSEPARISWAKTVARSTLSAPSPRGPLVAVPPRGALPKAAPTLLAIALMGGVVAFALRSIAAPQPARSA